MAIGTVKLSCQKGEREGLQSTGVQRTVPYDHLRWLSVPVATFLGFVASFAVLYLIRPLIHPTGAGWEKTWLIDIHRWFRGDVWLFFYYLGELGRKSGVTIVTLAGVAWWLLRGSYWKAALLFFDALMLYLFSPVTGLGAHWGLQVFALPRPGLFPNHKTYPEFVGTYGYPSGHGLLAFAFYGFIVFLALQGAPRQLRVVGWTTWAAWAAAFGFSRLVLGDHWPTQVLAGYVSGACILAGMVVGTTQWLQTRNGVPTVKTLTGR
ncbi:MAG: phosphatase PAP2 family protein [Clostridia bacterium]|nr:phosphatase PAP2 family protein [Clostridia bacterium]